MPVSAHPDQRQLQRRLLLTIALLSVGAAALAGSLGLWMARTTLERRLLQATGANLARIVTELHLPPSDKLLGQLRQISDCEIVLSEGDRILNSTLPLPAVISLDLLGCRQLATLSIAGVSYRAHSSALSANGQRQLWLLLPKSHWRQTLRAQTLGIAAVSSLTGLVAVLAGVWLTRAYQALLTRLDQAQQRLTRAENIALAGRISAQVVHELRNPLSGIRMNAQAVAEDLRERGIDDQGMTFIAREIERVDLYLDRLSGMTADQAAGNDGGDKADVLEVLDNLRQLLSGRARHAGITLKINATAVPNGLQAACSSIELRQVLLNVLLNALDASPAGTTVKLTANLGDADIAFAVIDQGAGVHVADGEDIFAPFVSSKSQGCGLGLHLVRKILERHRGSVTWENAPTGGACFLLRLPADNGHCAETRK